MKKYWKVIGIAALTAGALYYPAMKLYKYLVKKKGDTDEKEAEHVIKAFSLKALPCFIIWCCLIYDVWQTRSSKSQPA